MSDSKQKYVATGTVAFSNLVERDTYKGKPTKYGLTLTLTPEEGGKLEGLDVKVASYEGTPQRKFATNYQIAPVDIDGQPVWTEFNAAAELPRGTVVRIWYTLTPNEEYGMIPYLGGVKVLEMGEADAPEEF